MKSVNPPETELLPAKREETGQVPAMPNPAADVSMMLKMALEKGVTTENAAAMEKLMGLYERMQDRQAEQLFTQAFVALQADMPRITASQPVPGNDGGVRYRFAPYESIMQQIQPFMVKHGFTVSFSIRYDGPRIVAVCTLSHAAGHSRNTEFACQVGSGPPKASPAQADGAASTYAKRFALCNALNIVVKGMDNDAGAEGDTISEAKAEELRKRVKDTGSDVGLFLKFAGQPISDSATEQDVIQAFRSIRSGKLGVLEASLRKKEKP